MGKPGKPDQSELPFSAESTPPSSIRFKSHWGPEFLDTAWRFSIQLTCAGGSGALAKTAVAPLERVKVCGALTPSSPSPASHMPPASPPMRPSRALPRPHTTAVPTPWHRRLLPGSLATHRMLNNTHGDCVHVRPTRVWAALASVHVWLRRCCCKCSP